MIFWNIIPLVILARVTGIASAPQSGKFCVEQTKNRELSGVEPYDRLQTTDNKQCIARCIKDVRSGVALCKSVVYSDFTKLCMKYTAKAGELDSIDLLRVDEHQAVSYYEILTKCPNNVIDNTRRDDGNTQSQARPFADKMDDTAPPAFAPLPGYGPNEGAVQPPIQQQGTGGAQYGSGAVAPVQPQQPCCGQQIQTQVIVQNCCPAPQPQPCCPAPQPQPCCPAPQPQPCCPAPQPEPCCPAPPPPPQWGPWSEWSTCQQVPCSPGGGGGGSVQTRTRVCSGSGGCQGESEQRQNCGCLQGQWTAWGPPTTCSATCGSGVQTRSRSCTVPGTCPGSDTDQSPCGGSPCSQWSDWGPPEQCPVTCGQGSTVRRRKCVAIGTNMPAQGCQGPDYQQASCPSLPPCCSNWSPWSSCSSTCGSGVQTRTKTCQGGYGSSTEQQACAAQQPCCSDWSQWGGCQTVCGQGVQTRTRSCGNGPQSVVGSPTLPGGGASGCCNNQQQQPCQVACTPNTAYGNYFMVKRLKRSLYTPIGAGSKNITYTV